MGVAHKKGHAPSRSPGQRGAPPRSSGQKRHHNQAVQRSDKPPIQKPRRASWFGFIAELLGIGRPIGEVHDGVFVSGKPAKKLNPLIKAKLKSEKNPEKTLQILYLAFERACAREHDVNGGGSGGFSAKMYDGIPSGVRAGKCKSVMRWASIYSRIQDGLIQIPCTKIGLGTGTLTDLIPFVGGSGAALVNFFFFYMLLRRVGLKPWTAVGILMYRLLADAVLTAVPITGSPTGAMLQTTPRLAWIASTWALLEDALKDSEELEDGTFRSKRLESYFAKGSLPFSAALRDAFGEKDSSSSEA